MLYFVIGFIVLLAIGGLAAAVMGTDAGEAGCGCIVAALMLAGIGGVLLIFIFLFGAGCSLLMR